MSIVTERPWSARIRSATSTGRFAVAGTAVGGTRLEHRPDDIRLEDARRILEQHGYPFQAHPGVNALGRSSITW